MTDSRIEGLEQMGFIISKKNGKPYIIERLNEGKGILGPTKIVKNWDGENKKHGMSYEKAGKKLVYGRNQSNPPVNTKILSKISLERIRNKKY